MLLDAETFDLVQHIDTVLAAVAGHELEPVINAELMQSVLEIATPVCHTTSEVAEQLRKIRSYVCGVAREQGLRVGAAGTHPFSLFERQRITARDRYRSLVDQMQYVARRELIFGMHIHVAVDDPDKAIQVVNGLLAAHRPAARPLRQLAVLARRADRAALEPADGLRRVPAFRSAAAVRQLRGLRRGRGPLEKTGCIADYTHIWWDIRLHPRLGTIEVRICDAVTRTRARRRDRRLLPGAREALLRAVRPRRRDPVATTASSRPRTSGSPARYGLEAPVMDLATGRRNRVAGRAARPAHAASEIEPHARELGSERELEGIAEILGRGNGADRQLRVFNANRDIVEVVQRDRRRDGSRGRAASGEVGSPNARGRRQRSSGCGAGPLPTSGGRSTSCWRTGLLCFVFYLFDWSST